MTGRRRRGIERDILDLPRITRTAFWVGYVMGIVSGTTLLSILLIFF